ncbi:MAG TPA: hypothetical protein PLD59_02825 [Tepidisphaeraceae bacterium]|nr:hypothetical protein [Tepidisphaeraceae bacterium]
MRRSRIEWLMVAVALLALSAGVVGGLLAARWSLVTSGARAAAPGPPPLAEALGLTAEQREQMRTIWEGVRTEVRDTFEQARALERRRDQAFVSLLTNEQKAQYEKISQELAIEFDSLSHRRDQLFEVAVARTRTLLNAEQRARYEEILRARGPAGLDGARGEAVPASHFDAHFFTHLGKVNGRNGVSKAS